MRIGASHVTAVSMSARRPALGFPARVVLVVVLVLGALAAPALAQAPTTGSVRGVVTDQSGAALAGAIVSIRGPALQGTADVFAEADGSYQIDQLPPGLYTLTVTQGDAQTTRANVLVQLGKVVRVNLRMRAAAGEVIEVQGRAPLVDQGSTKTGVTLSENDLVRLPVGRNFDDLLEIAPGAQADRFGTSFGGSTSPENSYLIEGANVTDVGFGLATLTLPTEFLREVEIITGGYGAEYGRSSGGIVNAVTKSGSNELHGSVFGYFTPGELTGSTRFLPNENNSIVFQRELDYRTDVGFEVGGPLLEDTLWFHVGFSPSLQSQDANRVITRFFDRDGNGLPDRRDDGAIDYDEVDRRIVHVPARTYFFTSKVSYAASPEHHGSVTVFGNPSNNDLVFDDFAVGPDNALLIAEKRGTVAGVARWTSDILDGSGQLEVTVGAQRGRDRQSPGLAGGELAAVRFQETQPLNEMFEDVPAACMEPSSLCPVTNYQIGGIDIFSDDESTRLGGAVTYRHIFDALGRHRLKVGVDFEENRFDARSAFSGGTRWWSFTFDGTPGWLGIEFLTLDPDGDIPCGIDIDGDGTPEGRCSRSPGGRVADTATTNIGAYVQDSWTILPNLSVELGLRYERQGVGAAEQVAGMTDPFSGETVDDTAVALNNLAPRAGVIYDWTNEGRSRVFGHWGRYHESIPMDLNARGFSGETIDVSFYPDAACGDPLRPDTFDCDRSTGTTLQRFGGSKLVAPGISGQYMDEIVAGVEYEPLPDVKVGAVYTHRDLGRAIEDVSPDGGTTYVLANPGEFDAGAVADLRERADDVRGEDPAEAARLDRIANVYEGVGNFDRPRRIYDSLELSVVKRFSQRWMTRASYTYSRLSGNFAGLFSPDTNQLDPNFTSVYDLPELMFNRYGRLPGDQPHQLKLDAYYQLPVAGVGNFVIGGRMRGVSGRPHNYLASNQAFGNGESFLLPRGSGERNPLATSFDLQLAYGRPLARGMGIELFVSVFNLFNQQNTRRRDEIYTFNFADPIGGGDVEDLEHAKDETSPDGRVVSRNPNFDNPTELQLPVSVRFGARLTF